MLTHAALGLSVKYISVCKVVFFFQILTFFLNYIIKQKGSSCFGFLASLASHLRSSCELQLTGVPLLSPLKFLEPGCGLDFVVIVV